jgi:L-lactate dehydrogenase complex protein LldG
MDKNPSLFTFIPDNVPMQPLKTSRAKENILSRIRKGLSEAPLPMPFPEAEKAPVNNVFAHEGLSLEETFATAFIHLGGKFVYCDNEQELLEYIFNLHEGRGWQKMLSAEKRLLRLFQNNRLNIVDTADNADINANACITGCELLVARTGSILLSSKQHLGRTATVFYPVHIVVAYANQIVADIDMALKVMKKKYGDNLPSMINLNTGPSRTADIEKTLVTGVHGPAEVFCFFVNK